MVGFTRNGIIRDNDKTYYCDEEGIATDVTGGGWVQRMETGSI